MKSGFDDEMPMRELHTIFCFVNSVIVIQDWQHQLPTELLIGCGKKIKIMGKFLAIIFMWKHALITWKLNRTMRKFKQVIKLIIGPFQCTYMLYMVNQDSKFQPKQLQL